MRLLGDERCTDSVSRGIWSAGGRSRNSILLTLSRPVDRVTVVSTDILVSARVPDSAKILPSASAAEIDDTPSCSSVHVHA